MSVLIKSITRGLTVSKGCNLQGVRFIPRWSHRKPLRVLTEADLDEVSDKDEVKNKAIEKNELEPKNKVNWRFKSTEMANEAEGLEKKAKLKRKSNFNRPKVTSVDMLETVFTPEGNFIYTKMSDGDGRVGSLLTTIKSKKETLKRDLILLEGKRLIKDALQAGCVLKYLLFSRQDEVEYLKGYLPKNGAQLYKMPYREMQMWSDLTTTPGIMGLFRTPETDKFESENPIPLTIICDNIREPGNLGSVLRGAAGVGCEKLILTKGCVNLWDTKVIRSAAGCHFRMKIENRTELNDVRQFLKPNSRILIADNKLVSSEQAGDLTDLINSVPLLNYGDIQVNERDELVLIIGGETVGISEDSYKLANEFNGARLHIPLSNKVESLNTGVALGILAFELKRQLTARTR